MVTEPEGFFFHSEPYSEQKKLTGLSRTGASSRRQAGARRSG
jgi:hypothetical protein